MPSFSPRRPFHQPFSRHAKWLLVAVTALTALVALPHVHAATPPATKTASAVTAADHAAPTPAPPAKKIKAPTCQAIMQRLSGSLAGTPSNTDKPGAVLVDVDKAGVTMACSHSDAVAIPVPGNSKTR
ncbi:glycoprotein [Ralstonia sp. UBA689]|uniref:glycoprotein n=1 Tax=Ralstonia sp. UBA689 TaxID=1947373 RepID=UPI0025F0A3C4|nr:glycoprotein [Ralstonia sp. UBA689]